MNPYKTVSDRHRVLEALERMWDKQPTKDLHKLIVDLFPEETDITDSKLCRAINKRLR